MVVLGSRTTPQSQPQEESLPAQGPTGAQERALFLHLLDEPGAETNPRLPAQRIVTTRVYPFQDFAVSIGDPEDPFTKPWNGAFTNPVWSKDGSPEARPLAALWNSGDATLAGRIQLQNGKFLARLQGRNRTTLGYFAGEIELDKPVYEQGGYYHGGAIWGVWFALSTNADCNQFLRALNDGSLRRPNIVEKNSPEADRWLRGQPSAEPNGAANGSQPIRSETNQPAGAAGSRR